MATGSINETRDSGTFMCDITIDRTKELILIQIIQPKNNQLPNKITSVMK